MSKKDFVDFKVEIDEDSSVETFSGVSKAGKDYSITKQEAWLHKGDKYPVRFSINIDSESEQDRYPVGEYSFSNLLSVDSYGTLVIARDVKLVV